MDSAPASPADARIVSLWQNNLVGLRAERFINWKRARANGVQYLTGDGLAGPGAHGAARRRGGLRAGKG